MAQPYVGEIRMFAGNFAPVGWLFCEGQLLPISENETLFQLIGTTYGGDGESTFGLPDLRGRLPIHQGNGFALAETGGAGAGPPTPRPITGPAPVPTPQGNGFALAEPGGVEEVTLTTNQMTVHGHAFTGAASPGNQTSSG